MTPKTPWSFGLQVTDIVIERGKSDLEKKKSEHGAAHCARINIHQFLKITHFFYFSFLFSKQGHFNV